MKVESWTSVFISWETFSLLQITCRYLGRLCRDWKGGRERICALISRENINITFTLQGIPLRAHSRGFCYNCSAKKRKTKEGTKKLDLIMVATLVACCGLVYLLVHWCHKQVDSNEMTQANV